jgi:hypothetical protein
VLADLAVPLHPFPRLTPGHPDTANSVNDTRVNHALRSDTARERFPDPFRRCRARLSTMKRKTKTIAQPEKKNIFGRRVRLARTRSNPPLSQQELSDRLGTGDFKISPAAIE